MGGSEDLESGKDCQMSAADSPLPSILVVTSLPEDRITSVRSMHKARSMKREASIANRITEILNTPRPRRTLDPISKTKLAAKSRPKAAFKKRTPPRKSTSPLKMQMARKSSEKTVLKPFRVHRKGIPPISETVSIRFLQYSNVCDDLSSKIEMPSETDLIVEDHASPFGEKTEENIEIPLDEIIQPTKSLESIESEATIKEDSSSMLQRLFSCFAKQNRTARSTLLQFVASIIPARLQNKSEGVATNSSMTIESFSDSSNASVVVRPEQDPYKEERFRSVTNLNKKTSFINVSSEFQVTSQRITNTPVIEDFDYCPSNNDTDNDTSSEVNTNSSLSKPLPISRVTELSFQKSCTRLLSRSDFSSTFQRKGNNIVQH